MGIRPTLYSFGTTRSDFFIFVMHSEASLKNLKNSVLVGFLGLLGTLPPTIRRLETWLRGLFSFFLAITGEKSGMKSGMVRHEDRHEGRYGLVFPLLYVD